MITPMGFIDTTSFTAMLVVKYRERAENGTLFLRKDDTDLPIVKEWKSARALLQRIRNRVAEATGSEAVLGNVFTETLPPQCGTPWTLEDDKHSAKFVRFRVCLMSAPGCWSFCGTSNAQLSVGIINLIENRLLCSEANFSDYPRTHLIVEVERPNGEA